MARALWGLAMALLLASTALAQPSDLRSSRPGTKGKGFFSLNLTSADAAATIYYYDRTDMDGAPTTTFTDRAEVVYWSINNRAGSAINIRLYGTWTPLAAGSNVGQVYAEDYVMIRLHNLEVYTSDDLPFTLVGISYESAIGAGGSIKCTGWNP